MPQRRSDRVYLQVPIRVSGRDASDVPFAEETVTVNINSYGACITLAQSLAPGQIVRIQNLGNKLEREFRVVGLVRKVFGERAEWGVELMDGSPGFWAVEFTPPPDSIQPKVLIQCKACSKATLAPLSLGEYDLLLQIGLVSRHCDRCDETTRWLPAIESAITGGGSPASTSLGHDERRKTRRMRLTMRVQLSRANGNRETVQTLDVSKGGLCFRSKEAYEVGERISFLLPHRQDKGPAETKGLIVRSSRLAGGWLYGVAFAPSESDPAKP